MSELAKQISAAVETLRQAEAEEAAARAYRHQAAIQAGSVLRVLREHYGLSLRKAASMLGISAPYLLDMERGNRCTSTCWIEDAMKTYPEGTHHERAH